MGIEEDEAERITRIVRVTDVFFNDDHTMVHTPLTEFLLEAAVQGRNNTKTELYYSSFPRWIVPQESLGSWVDIMDWCVINLGRGHAYHAGNIIYFDTEENYLLFVLRWGASGADSPKRH